MPKIRRYVSMGLVGCRREDTIEIDDEEWSEMTQEERDTLLDEEAQGYANNHMDFGAYVVED